MWFSVQPIFFSKVENDVVHSGNTPGDTPRYRTAKEGRAARLPNVLIIYVRRDPSLEGF